jgi:rhodanese-related sulfurtransferase
VPIPQISPAELAHLLALPASDRPVLLDVRSPEEHAYVALPGSVLIPLHELAEREDEVDALQGKEVVVYCHHGIRSLDGAAVLMAKGIRARSLSGGIDQYAVQVAPTLRRY